jgi:hypothetical protein
MTWRGVCRTGTGHVLVEDDGDGVLITSAQYNMANYKPPIDDLPICAAGQLPKADDVEASHDDP